METTARPTPHGRRRVYVYIRLTMGNQYGPSKPNTLGPKPSSRSEDREVNTATPRARSQEPAVEAPGSRWRSRDRDVKTATQRWSPRPRRYDREPNLPRPRTRRQDHDQEIEAKGLAVRGALSRPQVRQVKLEGPKPGSRSEDREVKTATPRARSQEREAKTRRTGPGTQDEEVTTTSQEPVAEAPDSRGRSRDLDVKTATQR
jgi:hypothetical protein